MNQTTQTTQTEATPMGAEHMRSLLHLAFVAHGDEIGLDPRHEIVRQIIYRYESYTNMLRQIARSIQFELDRLQENGLRYVHSSAKTSNWDDLPKIGAQVEELRSILYSTTKAADDPTATAMDRMIHLILPE